MITIYYKASTIIKFCLLTCFEAATIDGLSLPAYGQSLQDHFCQVPIDTPSQQFSENVGRELEQLAQLSGFVRLAKICVMISPNAVNAALCASSSRISVHQCCPLRML